MSRFHPFRLLIGGLLLAVLLVGCGDIGGGAGSGGGSSDPALGGGVGGSGDGGGDDEPSSGLQLVLVGREVPGIEALNVTVDQVEIHDADRDVWIALPVEAQDLDVVSLVDGLTSTLADVSVKPGDYDQIRVVISRAHASVLGEFHDLKVLDGGRSILLPDDSFRIESDFTATVELDFDPLQSIKFVGQNQFMLFPELTVVNYERLSTISGTVSPAIPGAEVRAYQKRGGGSPVAAALVRSNGTFTLPRLPVFRSNGNLNEYEIVAKAPGYSASEPYDGVTLLPGTAENGFDFVLEPISGYSDDDAYEQCWEEHGVGHP